MSQEAGRRSSSEASAHASAPECLTVESGLDALRASPEFHGTVEPMDDRDGFRSCEHLALFYRSESERFATVRPFIRQGIARGERIMYVIDELTPADILAEVRTADVDVDAAVESGQLTFHTLEETYLRPGHFDPDGMLEQYAAVLDETEGDYPGLRVTANTNWILDDHTDLEAFLAYESRVNELFDGRDCIALCHYDCRKIPPETLVDVIRTHPHLIYDNTVCHNFYYTPPDEYFEPDEPMRDVERMLGTLVDRSRARAELNETIAALEESNERLGRFAYVASHDLQEPLRMISSYLQLLESRYEADLDDDASEFIDIAISGADRMREMVDGLLAYSRIDMDETDPEPVCCTTVVNAILTDHRVCIEESGATIEVADLPTIHGRANQIEQLFSNLVANAIKYSGDEPPHVEISANRASDRHEFAVADRGIGIDPAYADQIFEVFGRLHSNDEYEGTGIGLALCRKIVAHHGGGIRVESEPGAGTTFRFSLPAAAE